MGSQIYALMLQSEFFSDIFPMKHGSIFRNRQNISDFYIRPLSKVSVNFYEVRNYFYPEVSSLHFAGQANFGL